MVNVLAVDNVGIVVTVVVDAFRLDIVVVGVVDFVGGLLTTYNLYN